MRMMREWLRMRLTDATVARPWTAPRELTAGLIATHAQVWRPAESLADELRELYSRRQ